MSLAHVVGHFPSSEGRERGRCESLAMYVCVCGIAEEYCSNLGRCVWYGSTAFYVLSVCLGGS